MLGDIAILTGGQVISEEVGLKLETADARPARHGPQGRRHQGRDHHRRGCAATPTQIAGRVNQIRAEIEKSDSDYDREKLQERLAKLAGGVAVIKAGAATEVELKERKHRIEDAVRNAKAAVEEGIVAGGGVALHPGRQGRVRASSSSPVTRRRARTSSRVAVEAPLKQIAINAGLEGGVVAEKVAQPASRVRASTPRPASTST